MNNRSRPKSSFPYLKILVLPFTLVAFFTSLFTYELCCTLSPLGIALRNEKNIKTLATAISTTLVIEHPTKLLSRRYTGLIFVAVLFLLYFFFLYLSGRFLKHPNDCFICTQVTALSAHFILCLLIISSFVELFFLL